MRTAYVILMQLMIALASQSLSVVVALIPYIREFIRRHLNPKQAVMLTEFDKLKRVSRIVVLRIS